MTGLRPTLGLFLLLSTASPVASSPVVWATPASAKLVDEVQDSFNQAVQLLRRGRTDEARAEFQKILAMSPSQESAYALWTATKDDVWTDLLVEGGDIGLAAKRLIALARLERKARQNDPAKIAELVKVATSDAAWEERVQALRTLESAHGDYAAAYLVPMISAESGGDDERRSRAMLALQHMGRTSVLPLLAALASDDPTIRRNAAFALGSIGDRRAAGALLSSAQKDPDSSVQTAAREAAARMKLSGSASSHFLALGDGYHHRRDDVLRDMDYSDVVWSWKDGKLTGDPVPRMLYNDELAKRAYAHALDAEPASTEALAGLARSYVSEMTKIDALTAAGKDTSEWKSRTDEARMALSACGADALDLALAWSVKSNDASTAAGLCRVLGPLCITPTPGLLAAVRSSDGAMRTEAALALGGIATGSGQAASPQVVGILGEAAGREILRLVALIDADAARSAALVSALTANNVLVHNWSTGARGLGMLGRLPGIDAVLVAESLPDLTTAQVIDELRTDERHANTPVFVIAKDKAAAAGIYGDKIQGTVAGGEDVATVTAALEADLTGDRARADVLSKHAAEVLARLAQGGQTDLSAAVPHLLATLGKRPDEVTIPAMMVIRTAGGADHAVALLEVLANAQQSDAARDAAGTALAGVLGRHPQALSNESFAQLSEIVAKDASVVARDAAARALALVNIDPAARLELLRRVRAGNRAVE